MTQRDADYVDILVAGGGLAGLAAALACAQHGQRVRVVEKRASVGGNATISAGAIWAPPSIEHIHHYVPDGDLELQKMLVENLPQDLVWLLQAGLPLSDEESLAGFGVGRVMQGGASGRHDQFMAAMADLIIAQGGSVQTGLAVTSVVRMNNDDLCVGLSNGRSQTARALVLATGGYQGSAALLERYLGRQRASALRLRALPGNIGDGLCVARSLGAATGGDMTAFYGHSMPDCSLSYEDMQPLTPYFARYGILLNRNGDRFVDEAAALLEEANPQEGCRQPGGKYYLFFDRRIYEEHGINQNVISAVPSIDRLSRLLDLGAPVFAGASIEALVEQLAGEGVALASALSTIRTYNDACRQGTAHLLTPNRSRHAIPLNEPPFYALRCVPAITNTCGGIRIDAQARVLDRSGQVIRGLYAAGGDAGGVFGKRYAGFLGWALSSGRTAGTSAAARA